MSQCDIIKYDDHPKRSDHASRAMLNIIEYMEAWGQEYTGRKNETVHEWVYYIRPKLTSIFNCALEEIREQCDTETLMGSPNGVYHAMAKKLYMFRTTKGNTVAVSDRVILGRLQRMSLSDIQTILKGGGVLKTPIDIVIQLFRDLDTLKYLIDANVKPGDKVLQRANVKWTPKKKWLEMIRSAAAPTQRIARVRGPAQPRVRLSPEEQKQRRSASRAKSTDAKELKRLNDTYSRLLKNLSIINWRGGKDDLSWSEFFSQFRRDIADHVRAGIIREFESPDFSAIRISASMMSKFKQGSSAFNPVPPLLIAHILNKKPETCEVVNTTTFPLSVYVDAYQAAEDINQRYHINRPSIPIRNIQTRDIVNLRVRKGLTKTYTIDGTNIFHPVTMDAKRFDRNIRKLQSIMELCGFAYKGRKDLTKGLDPMRKKFEKSTELSRAQGALDDEMEAYVEKFRGYFKEIQRIMSVNPKLKLTKARVRGFLPQEQSKSSSSSRRVSASSSRRVSAKKQLPPPLASPAKQSTRPKKAPLQKQSSKIHSYKSSRQLQNRLKKMRASLGRSRSSFKPQPQAKSRLRRVSSGSTISRASDLEDDDDEVSVSVGRRARRVLDDDDDDDDDSQLSGFLPLQWNLTSDSHAGDLELPGGSPARGSTQFAFDPLYDAASPLI